MNLEGCINNCVSQIMDIILFLIKGIHGLHTLQWELTILKMHHKRSVCVVNYVSVLGIGVCNELLSACNSSKSCSKMIHPHLHLDVFFFHTWTYKITQEQHDIKQPLMPHSFTCTRCAMLYTCSHTEG